MLVLSRKEGEQIVIGDDPKTQAVVTLIEIRGNQVRLGIKAPRDIPVNRREIMDIPPEDDRSNPPVS